MKITLPTRIFKLKLYKKESDILRRTLCVKKDGVFYTNSVIVCGIFCENKEVNQSLHLDFLELKKFFKDKIKGKEYISFYCKEVLPDDDEEDFPMYEIINADDENDSIIINQGVPHFPEFDFLIDENNYTHKIELNHNFSRFAKMTDYEREMIFNDEIRIEIKSNLYDLFHSVKNDSSLSKTNIKLCKHRNSFKLISGKKPATWYFGEKQKHYMVRQDNILHVEMENA